MLQGQVKWSQSPEHPDSIRILSLEDNASDAYFIQMEINAASPPLPASFQVVSSKADFEQALRTGCPDLILCDYSIPGYGGEEALETARRILPDVPVIILTGQIGEELAVELLKAGAADYVFKDRIKRLVPSIRRALKEAALDREKRQADENFRALVETSPQGIFITQKGTIVYVNPAAVQLVRAQDPHEVLGRSFLDFLHKDQHARALQKAEEMKAPGGRAGVLELTIVRLDGSAVDVESITAPILFQGEPAHQLVLRDITKRKQAEAALQESEQRFRTMADSAPMAIWVTNAGGEAVMTNRVCREFFGVTEDEMRSAGAWERLVHPDDLPRYVEAFRQAFQGQTPFEITARGRHVSGEWRWMLSKAQPRLSASGEFLGMVGSTTDIHQQKVMELALRDSQERFRVMANSTPVMIWAHNAAGEIEFVNRAYEEFFGVKEADIRGSSGWKALVHPEDAEQYIGKFQKAMAERAVYDAEARVRHSSGEWRWIHSYGAPRFGADGEFQGFVGSSPDVTQMKQAEEALRQSAENLRLMVEASSQPMIVVRGDGVIETSNSPAAAALGHGDGELAGRSVLDIIVPVSRIEMLLWINDLKRHAPRPVVSTVQVKTPSGAHNWVTVEARLMTAAPGQEKYLVRLEKLQFGPRPTR